MALKNKKMGLVFGVLGSALLIGNAVLAADAGQAALLGKLETAKKNLAKNQAKAQAKRRSPRAPAKGTCLNCGGVSSSLGVGSNLVATLELYDQNGEVESLCQATYLTHKSVEQIMAGGWIVRYATAAHCVNDYGAPPEPRFEIKTDFNADGTEDSLSAYEVRYFDPRLDVAVIDFLYSARAGEKVDSALLPVPAQVVEEQQVGELAKLQDLRVEIPGYDSYKRKAGFSTYDVLMVNFPQRPWLAVLQKIEGDAFSKGEQVEFVRDYRNGWIPRVHFGDSGGPAYVKVAEDKLLLLGIACHAVLFGARSPFTGQLVQHRVGLLPAHLISKWLSW